MPRFGTSSKKQLATCDARLQSLFMVVVKEYDCTIIQGHRGEEAQMRAYLARPQRSKIPWPKGKHNQSPSIAVDAAPYPIDWQNTKRFYHFAGYVQGIAQEMGLELRWGGDWDQDYDLDDQEFNDLVHFELVDK